MLHIVNLKLERHLLQMELFIPVGNIENSSFGATICAERCAISKAVSEGHKNIQKIAIVSSSGNFTPPCGICRQVMEEFMADGTVVLSNGKEIKEYTVRELLPAGFSAEDMKG